MSSALKLIVSSGPPVRRSGTGKEFEELVRFIDLSSSQFRLLVSRKNRLSEARTTTGEPDA